MARKSKRLALNEAIRQGQAKIAEGLKTGQMRSDNLSAQAPARGKELSSDSVSPFGEKGRTVFLKSKEKSTMGKYLSAKAKLILLSCVVAVFMVIWLMTALMDSAPSDQPDNSAALNRGNEAVVAEESNPVREPERTVRETEVEALSPVVSKGDNVIWIQTISLGRQSELLPLRDFFDSKGIPTEIIEHRDSGKPGLVTKEGFKKNPAAKGTEGYVLLQRIKQLGVVYVEEAEDTKFGVKPFQDAYGYKR